MKQMVFVVLDSGEVMGVYDEYEEAKAVASEAATITPVIVGQTDDCRVGCTTPNEVIMAMEDEFYNLCKSYISSDEDEDDWEDEDEDEDEEDNAVYSLTVKGEFVLQYMDAGHTYKEACEIANLLFGEGE